MFVGDTNFNSWIFGCSQDYMCPVDDAQVAQSQQTGQVLSGPANQKQRDLGDGIETVRTQVGQTKQTALGGLFHAGPPGQLHRGHGNRFGAVNVAVNSFMLPNPPAPSGDASFVLARTQPRTVGQQTTCKGVSPETLSKNHPPETPAKNYPRPPSYLPKKSPTPSNERPKDLVTQPYKDWLLDSRKVPDLPSSKKKRDTYESGNEENSADDDDDEPLRTRVQRHYSISSDPDATDVEIMSMKKKPLPRRPTATSKPQRFSAARASSDKSSPSSVGEIDWTLPSYEAQYKPGPTKNDAPIAKISIPGLVREELMLSPDHAEQEVHLLLNVFLPAQQALAVPEPEPAVAVLNFHTIALMVIEAYTQFEIGDEFGTGRGHWHDEHDRGDEEYARLRNAKDADPDEIFFAVIDRWRAGMESSKQGAKLVRGSQEFCDVALDLVYYIKENGLLREEKVEKKEVIKRGAKKVTEVEGEAKKRKSSANTVEARKKVKLDKGKGTPKSKVPKKKKRAEPSLVVYRAG